MSEKDFELRLVGIIGKPHGIKGEVILNVITDYPNTIIPGLVLILDNPAVKSLEIEYLRNVDFNVRKTVIAKFKEINDRNAAEALRGEELYRKDSELPKNLENVFWIDDLLECSIVDSNGKKLAKVLEVIKGEANDSLYVKRTSNDIEIIRITQKYFFIPMTEDYIKEINIKTKEIVINKIPEYI